MIRGFAIIGIAGRYKLTAVDTKGNTYKRYFDTVDQCFKWLKGCERHARIKD